MKVLNCTILYNSKSKWSIEKWPNVDTFIIFYKLCSYYPIQHLLRGTFLKHFTHSAFTRTLWRKFSYLLMGKEEFSYFAKVTELGSDGPGIPIQLQSPNYSGPNCCCVYDFSKVILNYNFSSKDFCFNIHTQNRSLVFF